MTTLLIHARAQSLESDPIDFQLAQNILDRLGYTLQDLSLEYGDVCIGQDDISHQLWYDSIDNSCNPMGYIYVDNDMFYASVSHWNNHRTAEQAALDLLDRAIVEDARRAIEAERASSDMPDYF